MKISNKLSLEEIIKYLKKDNAKNLRSAKKEGIMMNWDLDKVKSVVDLYLDNVLRLSKEPIKLK